MMLAPPTIYEHKVKRSSLVAPAGTIFYYGSSGQRMCALTPWLSGGPPGQKRAELALGKRLAERAGDGAGKKRQLLDARLLLKDLNQK
jgi:hypothetical protein